MDCSGTEWTGVVPTEIELTGGIIHFCRADSRSAKILPPLFTTNGGKIMYNFVKLIKYKMTIRTQPPPLPTSYTVIQD